MRCLCDFTIPIGHIRKLVSVGTEARNQNVGSPMVPLPLEKCAKIKRS
jgi:hypothetical protein